MESCKLTSSMLSSSEKIKPLFLPHQQSHHNLLLTAQIKQKQGINQSTAEQAPAPLRPPASSLPRLNTALPEAR